MTPGLADIRVEADAALPTWFGVGGRAEVLARPESVAQLRACVERDPELRVLGDGANLLVDDGGVGGLVVSLRTEGFRGIEWDMASGRVMAGAGVNLPQLITDCVRRGLGGLEGLAGIPASVGGAVVMNAGGAFGEIARSVVYVHAVDRAGRERTIERSHIEFGYRQSHLNHLIITGVELALTPGEPEALRAELRRCMAYKKGSQPLKEHSAGCCFKNPELAADLDGIGAAGQRVSAGLLLDRAGCKGIRQGGASVSEVHANFVVVGPGATAGDVIALMDRMAQRVLDAFGVTLQREVVVWGRGP